MYLIYSTSNTIEGFLQDIIIENTYFEEEEVSHPTRIPISIYG